MRATIVFLIFLTLTSCSRPQMQTLQGPAQGSSYHISWWSESAASQTRATTEKVKTEIEAEFQRLDRRMSNYRADSDIELFNANPSALPQPLPEEIVQLVQAARSVHQATQGCYDPTVKPLFELWGFTQDQLIIPSEESITKTLAYVGMDKLEVQDSTHLKKQNAKVHVDLSSIAQGYSTQRIAAILEAAGIENYLVEIGGEMKVRGRKPDGSHWRIGIESPSPQNRQIQHVLTLLGSDPVAVMTSGTYRHFFDASGQSYSHIIDPRTGRPVAHSLVSVTVIHSDPVMADAWSTGLLCLGNEALDTANRHGIAALFIEANNGKWREYASNTIQSDQWIVE